MSDAIARDPSTSPSVSGGPVPGVPVSQDSRPNAPGIGHGGFGDRALQGTLEPLSGEKKVFPATARRSSVRKHRLKPTQEAFIKHYTDPTSPAFGNGTEAYARAHPACTTRGSAEVGAVRTLGSDKVQEVLAEHWGVERLEAEMEWNVRECKNTQKYADHREGIKVLAQLTGNWKEKSEVTHLEDAQKDAIRREVSKALGSN